MKLIRAAFVITLALSLIGGVLFVLAQAVGVVAGQGQWLLDLNKTVKTWIVVVSSICAILGFLLTYSRPAGGSHAVEASDAH